MKVKLLPFIFILALTINLIGCASPQHFHQSYHPDNYLITSKLPAVGYAYLNTKETKRMCVDVNRLNCFDVVDRTGQEVFELLTELDAFEYIDSWYNQRRDKAIKPNASLMVRYSKRINESTGFKIGQLVFNMFTIFMVPVNANIKHEIQVTIYQANAKPFKRTFMRETTEAYAWYTVDSYKQQAIKSMLSELIETLHREAVLIP